jgi:hypothetical protein
MENKFIDYEQKVLESLKTALNRHAEGLAKLQLNPKINDLRCSEIASKNYFSEISVYFYDHNNNLFDVIEFFIFRDAKPVASLDKIENWLEETINDIKMRRHGL